ncbi:MAG: hypothetical protein ACHQRK_05890 [Gemmatimonadales bacterium]
MTSAVTAPIASARVLPGAPVPVRSNVRLAGEHFAAATLYLVVGAVGLLWIAPELSIGAYASPHVAGVTHLFTLGWLTTTIFGALHQLLPVALGAPVRSRRVGHIAFWTFAPGAGVFAAGVATSSTMLHHVGLALLATGIVLAVGNVAASLARAPKRDVTFAAIAVAISFLASTLVLGVVLVHNLHTGFLGEARVRVLAIHLHVALVGWALVMMVGVSHRLMPMFLLSHGGDTRWTKPALVLLTAGVISLAAGLASPSGLLAWLGVVCLESGVGCLVWQARCFYAARLRRTLDVGMRFAAIALAFLVSSALLGPAVLARGIGHPRLGTAYVTLGLLGGIVLFVVGFFYKIVPLLTWTVRYRDRMGRGTAPTIAQMYSARVAHFQLGLMTSGVVLLGSGIGAASVNVVRAGAAFFLAGVLVFVSQIVRVVVGSAA